MKIDRDINWMKNNNAANYWRKSETRDDVVVCKLSPRNCKIVPGKMGVCGVRGNVDGELRTFNYGKSVEATMEVIETEAINHYMPGAKILSLGNIGCMMSCDFCQNWKTSQVRHLNQRDVRMYTPEEIVETCELTGIGVISWTYNDPVVWHEFVVETSKLAQKKGIVTLYKSAFYIEEEPVKELLECIDIFSISLKSMDNGFYRKFTGGAYLQPVLDRIKQVHESDRHLEISQLIITGRNDNAEEISKTNDWIVENVGCDVPLHYVGFHPAYLYVDTTRTEEKTLLMAQQMAFDAGIRHCYVGNVFHNGVSDTKCLECGGTLVRRFGLDAEMVGLTPDNKCKECGTPSSIRRPFENAADLYLTDQLGTSKNREIFSWNDESQSVHIEIDYEGANCDLSVKRLGGQNHKPQAYRLGGVLKRIIVSKQEDNETGIEIAAPDGHTIRVFPVLDRAHFPTSTELNVELKGYREIKLEKETTQA